VAGIALLVALVVVALCLCRVCKRRSPRPVGTTYGAQYPSQGPYPQSAGYAPQGYPQPGFSPPGYNTGMYSGNPAYPYPQQRGLDESEPAVGKPVPKPVDS